VPIRRLSIPWAIALLSLWFAACRAGADTNGVIFLYHHVDDDTPRSTSVSPREFRAQLEYLEREGYTVIPLMDLVEALAAGRELPPRSVAITFDDGYRTLLSGALPELSARGWPFTVFVSTEAIDAGYGGFLSWDDVRRLVAAGAAIGNHSVSHAHLVRRLEGESEAEWERRVRGEIREAKARLEAEVGESLIPVFAYPYGEYTSELKAIVTSEGLYGLGQQSGAVGAGSDLYALPRYPVASGMDLDADFALRARSRPLPLSPVGREEHIVGDADARPRLRLRLAVDADVRVSELACYVTGQGRVPVEWTSEAMQEFVVRPGQALGSGRSKLNCTAPSRAVPGVYHWYGYVWMRRLPDGSWYDE